MKRTSLILITILAAVSLLGACIPFATQPVQVVATAELPAEMVAKTVQAELTQISISTLVMELTKASVGGQASPVPPTATLVPPTATLEPPTATAQPPADTATALPPTNTVVPPTNTAQPPVNTAVPGRPQPTATRMSAAAMTQTMAAIPVVQITPIAGYKTPVPGSKTATPIAGYKSPTPNVTPISCFRAKLVSETIPDNTVFGVSTPFTKTWTIQNTGTCTWNSNYDWWYTSGDKMGGSGFTDLNATVPPGGTTTVSVNLVAPAAVGEYVGYYQLRSDTGQLFGWGGDSTGGFWVKIYVR